MRDLVKRRTKRLQDAGSLEDETIAAILSVLFDRALKGPRHGTAGIIRRRAQRFDVVVLRPRHALQVALR